MEAFFWLKIEWDGGEPEEEQCVVAFLKQEELLVTVFGRRFTALQPLLHHATVNQTEKSLQKGVDVDSTTFPVGRF